jgi:hypothetical protein
MSPQSFNDAYSAVAPADPGFYSLTGTAPTTTTTTSPDATTSPDTTTTSPDGMTLVSPDQTVTPITTTADTTTTTAATTTTTTASTDTTTVTVTDPYDPTVTDTNVALNDPTLATPPATTTFTDTSSTSTFGTISPSTGGTTGGTTFGTTTTGSTTTAGTTTAGTTTTTTTATAGGGTTTTVTTPPPPPPPPSAQFMFSNPYLNLSPQTSDDGIPLFGQLLASDLMKSTWGPSVQLGTVSVAGFTPTSYTLTGGPALVAAAGGGWDIMGNKIDYNSTTTAIANDTMTVFNVPVMHLDINPANGVVTLSFSDPMGVIPYIQSPSFFQNFSITATDGVNSVTTQPFVFQYQPNVPLGGPQILLGDDPMTGPGIDTLIVSGGDSILWGKTGDDTLYVTSSSGTNLLFGDTGNDTMIWDGTGRVKMYGGDNDDKFVMASQSFLLDGVSSVNGGNGNDTLQLGTPSSLGLNFNFDGKTNVTNIENISISATTSVIPGAAIVTLDMQSVFDMTGGTGTLNISNLPGNTFGSIVNVDTKTLLGANELTGAPTISMAGSVETIQGTLISNGATVTLIIDRGNAQATDGITVTVN